MGKLFERGGEYLFNPEDDGSLEIPLHQNNMMIHMHRDTPYMDRIGIEDPRDSMFWTWFRADVEPTVFDNLADVAQRVGSVLLRSTPLTEVEDEFDKRHSVSEEEIDRLLGQVDD